VYVSEPAGRYVSTTFFKVYFEKCPAVVVSQGKRVGMILTWATLSPEFPPKISGTKISEKVKFVIGLRTLGRGGFVLREDPRRRCVLLLRAI
jgi:hypothetical protein